MDTQVAPGLVHEEVVARKGYLPIEQHMPIAKEALDAVQALFVEGWTVACGFSSGKDSSALMVLTLEAALRAKRAGCDPRILVLTGSTGIENPEIEAHARREHDKLRAMATRTGLDLTVHVAMPSLSESFTVSILGGRCLPTFAGMQGRCSQSWKVSPMNRLRKQVLAGDLVGRGVVTLTGTRYAESDRRAGKMTERGDSALIPVLNKHGDVTMSPLAWWETDDVWELLGYCSSGMVENTYSDQRATLEVYAAGGGTSCAVVSDMVSESKSSSKACGARFGCALCVAVGIDKSMESMLEDDAYRYMNGLNQLRNYIAATQFDFSRRNWIGRSIDERGMVQIGPSQYSPAEVLAIARYCMTLDAEEASSASKMGIEPRFELIPFDQMIALDVMWSLNGVHPAFQAVKEYKEIRMGARRYPVPVIVAMPRRKTPAVRYLDVGEGWETSEGMGWTGLNDPLADLAAEIGRGDYCMGHITASNGDRVLDTNTGDELSVDLESAWFAVEWDFDRMMETHTACLEVNGISWTAGYKWWMQRGAVAVSASHRMRHHGALKRTQFKERNGLAGSGLDVAAAVRRSTGAREVASTELALEM